MAFLFLLMDKFITRLKYYGIGFAIGMVFVFFFFQNRGCSWLPANRVKNAILDRVITLSDEQNTLLNKKGISKTDIIALLNDGEVDFEKSKRDGALKIYHLSNAKTELYFLLPKEAFTSEIKVVSKPVSQIKPSEKGTGSLLRFPNDNDLVFVDTTSLLNCQLGELGFINQRLILAQLKKAGKINFEKSNLYADPKPIVALEFPDKKGQIIKGKAIWYKNKINIFSLSLPFESACK